MERPSIQDYTDYRLFLSDYVSYRKANSEYWSYGLWARKLGIKSVSTLSMLVSGKRHIGPQVMEKMLRYFQFSVPDELYFRNLVKAQKLANNDSRMTVLLLQEAQNKEQTSSSQNELALSWMAWALREMCFLKEFSSDAQWMKEHLLAPKNVKQIEALWKSLLDEGLIQEHEGKYSPTHKVIAPKERPSVESLQKMHQDIFSLSERALTLPREERLFHHNTLAISKKSLALALAMIQKFQYEFSDEFQVQEADAVYLLSVQFFPLTK